MSKPIFIIKVDRTFNDNKMCQVIQERTERMLNREYYVIVVPCLGKPEPVFECYNVDKVEQTDIDTIRELIKNLMTE